MKRLNFVLAILLLWSVSGKTQVITTAATEKTRTTSKAATDKSQVVFCNYKTDTLTYEQLKSCNEINILTNSGMEITSYALVCRINENDIFESTGKGKFLPTEVIEKLIAGGVTHFWLEKLTAKNDDGIFNLGTRKFYLKK